ncbi:PRC-barrel domain-containing protein [Nitrosospira sp. Nsp1]|uniref:PRC-barrel domain-containing protein n=1 Tax=Nitrosospira sp. Nsp1 TaxID=136547 RepID=UPI00088AA68A|nr:PRC-barrel domain-containing protein [Nitrosospira sp. Nsp1]SCX56492.1 PRC-barrel domain-containing protein [Nitrosospira sp. Nsp1]
MNLKRIRKIIIATICSFFLVGAVAAQKDMTSAPGTNPAAKPMRSPAPGPNAAPGAITTAPGMDTPADSNGAAPDTAQSRLIASGWRVSKLKKATVYNDANQKIGKIDDFIVTKDGSLTFAVVNLGRFPGRGTYMVAIPTNDFSQIVPKVILPGKTKADLGKLPRFEYKLILGK